MVSSRLPGFYDLGLRERAEVISKSTNLNPEEVEQLTMFGNLGPELVETFIENSVGAFGLPVGIATNFQVNGGDVLVPMAVEETSVVAAASYGAKLARSGGGFQTSSTAPVMTGQIQVFLPEPCDFKSILAEHRQDLIDFANRGMDRLIARGGGTKDITSQYLAEINCLVVHVHVDTRDAMGANIVNTICEKLSPKLVQIFEGSSIGLRILTNLNDRRLARATCKIPASSFRHRDFSPEEVVARIVQAWQFADLDIYRATTHNKGVMNGIDPVLIATGNDWRAVEAGAHAWACRTGRYRPMTNWQVDEDGDLVGELEIPMAVGTVGGVTKLHPAAQIALKILGHPDAQKLAEIVCAVGLAQNLSALRALATEGIQHGHMRLHTGNSDLLRRANSKHH